MTEIAETPTTRTRLPLRHRYALRDAVGFSVETHEGRIGFVTAVRFAPFEYWPDEVIVEADPGGRQLRVPIDSVSAVLPREDRLLITGTPPGAKPIAQPREARLTGPRPWRLAAAAGAVLGLGGAAGLLILIFG